MLGTFQQTHLRIEIEAPGNRIRDSLLRPEQMQKWLPFVQLSPGLPEEFYPGFSYTTKVGLISIQHDVEIANETCLRILLSQGIDGYHEWHWGDGWVQSCLEGISILPLNLSQTASLMSLRQFLEQP